jgi:hypothetical protein
VQRSRPPLAAKRVLVRHPSRIAAHRAAKRAPSGDKVATAVTAPDPTAVEAEAAVRGKASVPTRPVAPTSHAHMNRARSAKRAAPGRPVLTSRVRAAKKAAIAVNAAAMPVVVAAGAADYILVRAVAAVGVDLAVNASGR